MSALINGEIDFYENPNIDFLPLLEKAKGVKLLKTGKIDSTQGMIRLNHLHPPFDNVKARQAMYYLINQEDFLRAIVGDPKYYKVCPGLLTCGGPYENDGGTHWMKEYNPKKALQLMKEAGYKGEPITVLAATDHNTITPATQVLIQAMREAGLNVDVAVDGLGQRGDAPRQEGPAEPGRLEHLRHHFGRRRLVQSGAAHLDRRGVRQGPVRLAVRSRGREAAQRLRHGQGPRTSARRSPRSCRRGRWTTSSTSRSASGTRRSPTAPTASTASCPTPASRCCGASRRNERLPRRARAARAKREAEGLLRSAMKRGPSASLGATVSL